MSSFCANRPTWAELNLENLAFNFHSSRNFVGQNIEYMAVVKADAYGHGAVECARRLENEGVDWFGVAIPEEGLELRKNGITKPILCLGGFWNGQEMSLIENKLTPIIYQSKTAELFDKACKQMNLKANIHVKIDTGMGRIGVPMNQVESFLQSIKNLKNIEIEGIMTHFAAADDLSQNDYTDPQIERFNQVVKLFEENGYLPKYKDLANSPGAIAHQNSRSNMVRLGGILYGLGDDVLPKEIIKPELKPVMSIYSRINQIKTVFAGETLGYGRTFRAKKKSHIATIPIGYQDGFARSLSNKGKVIINNVFAPIVGRISMDWTIIDVTDVPNVKVGDQVILIGKSGNLQITAENLAELTGTISYEITCGINRRVMRKYVGSK